MRPPVSRVARSFPSICPVLPISRATPRQVRDRPLTMLAGAGLTDAGENVPLAVLMRAGGNWIEPSVLPAASSSLSSLGLTAHGSDRLAIANLILRPLLNRTALP